MIRWRIIELLGERGWTPYRLAHEAGITIPAAYRLAKDKPVQRIDTATLESLCDVFRVAPCDLIERVPNPRHRARR